jgi:hypothetical protein
MARERLGLYLLHQEPGYSYKPFQQEALCVSLEALARGELDKLIIHAPPRMGKSEVATVHFPSWYLGHHPEHSVMTISSSGSLAAGFGRKTRNLIESPRHLTIFPQCQIAWDSRAKDDFSLTAGGHYYAMGLDGQMTGRGAHLIVMDDWIKSTQDAMSEAAERFRREIFTSAVQTRLEPGGVLLVVQTVWPGDAFTGWLKDTYGAEDLTTGDLRRWRQAA